MRIDALISPAAVVPRLAAATPEAAVRELMAALVAAGSVSAESAELLVEAALARERSATTGFGKGVAVPHAKDARVTRSAAALGVSEAGIDFKAVDGRPVHIVVLLVSPAEAEAHLAAMNALWPVLGDAARRREIRQATTPGQLAAALFGGEAKSEAKSEAEAGGEG